MSFSVDTLKSLWREMLRIRLFEETVATRYAEQEMRCPVHLSIGQEAVAVGVSSNLTAQDWVYSNHRSHAHYLAKGGDMTALIAEFYGLEAGCVGGRGGSMHLMDLNAGFAGSTPIVGGTVPIATGAAWGRKLQQSDSCIVSYLGDGCFEEGVVSESLNFAALQQLPIIYVLENNLYSVYTPLQERQPRRNMAQVAQAMGLKTWEGDGNNIEEVVALAKEAVAWVKAGKGPVLLQFATYRWPEHCGPNDDDHLGYRPEGELQAWQTRCPIKQVESKLQIGDQERLELQSQIQQKIDHAWNEALASPPPVLESKARGVYVD